MRFRQFQEKDFRIIEGWCNPKGEGLIYPPEYYESNESFRKRLEQFPEGCCACVNDNDEIIAYMFSHPWDDTIVPLNCTDFKLPEKQTCFYIHDIAVIPIWRRKGIALRFLQTAARLAYERNYKIIKGISVLNSLHIWEKLGFKHISRIQYGGNNLGIIIQLELPFTKD